MHSQAAALTLTALREFSDMTDSSVLVRACAACSLGERGRARARRDRDGRVTWVHR